MLREPLDAPISLLSNADIERLADETTLAGDALLPHTQRVVPLRAREAQEAGVTISITTPLPAWLSQFVTAASRLLSLRDDWDTHGGKAINAEALHKSFAVLYRLNISNDEFPAMVPTSFGGIQMEWHTLAGDMEICVNPDTTVDASCELVTDDSEWEDENIVDYSGLRSRLRQVLSNQQ